jgi:tRNA modification GTPase
MMGRVPSLHSLLIQKMKSAHGIFRQSDAVDMAIAGEELRLAIRHLGKITGRVNIEDVLDVIFSDFCIGK